MKILILIAFVISISGCSHRARNSSYTSEKYEPNHSRNIYLDGSAGLNNKASTATDKPQPDIANKLALNQKLLIQNALVCETDSLLNKASSIMNKNFYDLKLNGLALMNYVNNSIDLNAKHIDNFRLRCIGNGIDCKGINEEERLNEELFELSRGCAVNKNELLVETIEKRPISKAVKVKLSLDNSYYEYWTYEYNLK